MRYFGARFATLDEDVATAPTPVGVPCGHCTEQIAAEDDGWLIPCIGKPKAPPQIPQRDEPPEPELSEPDEPDEPDEVAYHRECMLRKLVGSVEHQVRFGHHRCDGTCADDPALSVREAAKAAALHYYASGVRKLRRSH